MPAVSGKISAWSREQTFFTFHAYTHSCWFACQLDGRTVWQLPGWRTMTYRIIWQIILNRRQKDIEIFKDIPQHPEFDHVLPKVLHLLVIKRAFHLICQRATNERDSCFFHSPPEVQNHISPRPTAIILLGGSLLW